MLSRVVSTIVAGAESAALLGYAVSITYVALTAGIQGPVEVSSPAGVVVEIVTFTLFGVGMAVVAYGRWRRHGWATIPFIVAQLLALTVGIPLATGVPESRPVGYLVTAVAVVGLVSLFLGDRDPALDLESSNDQPRV